MMALQPFTEFNSSVLDYLDLIQPNAIPKMNRSYLPREGGSISLIVSVTQNDKKGEIIFGQLGVNSTLS